MTNTLHRKGAINDLKSDFIVFAMLKRSMGTGRELITKAKQFTKICLAHKPVNVGKLTRQSSLTRVDIRRINSEMENGILTTATFDNIEAVAAVVQDLKEADLGISINVSGLLEEVDHCCQNAGQQRHSVEQSLGMFGKTELLPPYPIVELNSLCGHGLVSFNLIKKVVDEIKAERMTLEQGSWHLAKPCECGVFNPVRARQLLEQLRLKG